MGSTARELRRGVGGDVQGRRSTHRPRRSRSESHERRRLRYIGENIFGASSGASAHQAVQSWGGEGASYNYASNSCAAGQICGHYTQIVWRDTTHVGCALHDCPGLRYGSTIVCDYGPGGNIDGQRPY
jgi:hypothetical protein